MDLSTPVDHASAHYWASVFLAHATIGLALTAALGSLVRSAWASAITVSVVYAIGWELWWQALGAGIADAAVDTLAVSAGALIAAAAWERKGGWVGLILLGLAIELWHGIRKRS